MPVSVQFHVHDALAQHDDSPGIALLSSAGEIEQEPAPDPDPPFGVALEPDSAEKNGVVQQHHVHRLAVAAGSLQHKVLDGLGAPPVPDDKRSGEEPDKGSEGHDKRSFNGSGE